MDSSDRVVWIKSHLGFCIFLQTFFKHLEKSRASCLGWVPVSVGPFFAGSSTPEAAEFWLIFWGRIARWREEVVIKKYRKRQQ